ncbi:hypothetical protein P9214_05595 [Heyndrickxia coagulans]|uniref:hypothetical protein n=1 Tax=Heyndrickxia coagulans TaxID=1398 RepID=UPI002E231695|nr:hypothetical protein [Heyndrickxia coagulans]
MKPTRFSIKYRLSFMYSEPVAKLVKQASVFGKSRIRSATSLAKDAPRKMMKKITDDIVYKEIFHPMIHPNKLDYTPAKAERWATISPLLPLIKMIFPFPALLLNQ